MEKMDVYEAVRTVLAVRQYQDKPVPPEVVARILEAGHLTASSMNMQPWHFILVNDRPTLQKMAAIVTSGPYIAEAPLAVVVAIEATEYAVSDASRAIQSMVLTAWSEGVGSNWTGFTGIDVLKALLGIPDALQVLAVIPFGYPVKKIGLGHKKRKPISEVVHRGKFGNPFKL
jgi:nitroreductase